MIVLTGDIHQMTLGTPDQACLPIPINTPPDHENLHLDIGNGGNSRFSDASQWAAEVLRQIERNELASTPSVILVHPACMAAADGMVALKWLISHLPARKCVTVSRLVDSVMSQPRP